ncbi:MAG: hypothetical protein KA105_01345 [Caulobacter sp.]|nr:hypothetical protein [Caulobacter sp.]
MPKIDVAQTAFAGFGVIARNPLALVGWAAFILVFGLLPVLLLIGGFAGSVRELAAAEAAGVDPNPEAFVPFFLTMFLLMPVLMIASLLMRAMLTGAVFRAVLEPDNGRWAFLRLGAQELWLILVGFVMSMGLGFVYMLLLIPVFPLSLVARAGEEPSPAVLALLPLWFCMVAAVLVFLLVRLSMALPMSFAERNFRLFESWKLTEGNSWRLVLVGLILMALFFAIELVIWGVALIVIGTVLGVGLAGQGEAAFERQVAAFFQQDAASLLAALAPWVTGLLIVGSLIGAAGAAVFTAPLAEAYRQLRANPAVPGA